MPSFLAMQTTTCIPLGAGMVYRVFLTSRCREELGLNLRFVEAWIRTMERAGPGVPFSGLASAIGHCCPAAPGSCGT